eukprot:EG_transcript_7351
MACRFFAAGHCHYGSRCRFQHLAPLGQPDIRIPRATSSPSHNPQTVSGPPPSASSPATASPPAEPERLEDTLLSLALWDGDAQDFECCICFDLLTDPRQCIKGHPCCLACLTRHLEVSQTCPTCRIPMQLETACRNLHLERQISALRFRCKNEGCSATFLRVERDQHEVQCQYRFVECACRCRVAVHNFYAHLPTCAVWRDAGRLAQEAAQATRRASDLEAEVRRLRADLDSRLHDADAALTQARAEVNTLRIWKEAATAELGSKLDAANKEQAKFSTMLDGILKELQKQSKSKGMSLEGKHQAILSHIRNLKQSLQEAEEKATAFKSASERSTFQQLKAMESKFSIILQGLVEVLRNGADEAEDICVLDDFEEQASIISEHIKEQQIKRLELSSDLADIIDEIHSYTAPFPKSQFEDKKKKPYILLHIGFLRDTIESTQEELLNEQAKVLLLEDKECELEKERDAAHRDVEALTCERNAALKTVEAVTRERDVARRNAEAVTCERNAALKNVEAVTRERDVARRNAEAMTWERNAARREYEACCREKDETERGLISQRNFSIRIEQDLMEEKNWNFRLKCFVCLGLLFCFSKLRVVV